MSTITTSISTINSWQILEAENPDPSYASTMVIYQNGRAIASGISSAATLVSSLTTAPLYINGRAATTTNSVPLYLAEVLLFTSPLTSTQRTLVESYLAQKWSLSSSLPTGHINFTRPAGVPATTQNLLTTFTSIPTNQTTITLTLADITKISWISYLKNITVYTWLLYQSATNAYAGTALTSGTTTASSVTLSVTLVSSNYYYFLLLATTPTGSYLATSPIVQYVGTTTTALSYTGAIQTYSVPANVTSVQVYMWGAGGGGKTNTGGAGAMVQGVLTVTPGETLNIVVGGGGSGATTTLTSAYGGGGAQGIGDGGNAGGGGGRAAIQRGGTAATNDIVVAGAGGGSVGQSVASVGGAATFSGTANDGGSNTGVQGRGGTQSAGGAGGAAGTYGTGTAGSRGQGGSVVNPVSASSNDGGGGGSGYYGGGGGGTNGGDGGGGGGGSSYTDNLMLIPGQSVLGFNSSNGYSAPNSTSPYYSAGVATGTTSAGGNGLVVIVATPPVTASTTALATVTTLAAPTSLTLSISGSTATLGWAASSGATGYSWSLYQSATNAYAGSFLSTGNSATTSATATSLTSSQYYYFTVYASSATAVSATSTQSSIVFYLPYLPLLFTTFFANTGSIPNRSGPVIAGGNGTNWGSLIQAAQALDPIYFGNNHSVSIAGNANYSAITTGFVYSASVGTIQFQGITDDGLIVNFNGTDVINQYQQQGATTYYSGSLTLPAGYTPIRITWYDTGGGGQYDIYFSINSAAYTNAGTGVYFHLASATY